MQKLDALYVKTINFYMLNIGDWFKYKGKKFKKTSEDGAEDLKDNFQIFWPQTTCYFLKILTQEQFHSQYPILEYYYN